MPPIEEGFERGNSSSATEDDVPIEKVVSKGGGGFGNFTAPFAGGGGAAESGTASRAAASAAEWAAAASAAAERQAQRQPPQRRPSTDSRRVHFSPEALGPPGSAQQEESEYEEDALGRPVKKAKKPQHAYEQPFCVTPCCVCH